MKFIKGTSVDIKSNLMHAMANYRHRVFVKKLGWQLRCENELEFDQFDRDDTVYLVAQNDNNEIIGTARLLPTQRPYLLAEVFPQLLNGLPAPASPEVWELSRFAAVDFGKNTSDASGQFSSPVAIELMRNALRLASDLGATSVVTVSPLAIERLLNRTGFKVHRMAPPVVINNDHLFACSVACEFQ
jgi:acyl homoserine lactone synthase